MSKTEDTVNKQMESIGKLKESMPDSVNAFMSFVQNTEKDGALDGKTKELIALSLAVKAECSYCISWHVKNCVDKGASKEEILEASMVAVLMGGGPALMYVKEVQDALADLGR